MTWKLPEKTSHTLEDNMKKALTELLLLDLLAQKEHYIGELTATLSEKSNGALNIVFPYAAIYRLQRWGYVAQTEKRSAPDGRQRQYFAITPAGEAYHRQLLQDYRQLSRGIEAALSRE